jgi:hypothetical protein
MYIDEKAAHSDTWRLHLKHLEKFLKVISESGLTFNIKRCHFAQPEVKFLGHIVGSGRYRADPDKVAIVPGLTRPQNKKEGRQIMGFLAHFQSYIPSYVHIAKRLTDLTAKRTPNKITWPQEHEDAFQRLKSLLCEAATKPLFIVYYNAPFNISGDGSNHAVSGLMSQTDQNYLEKPTAFTNHKSMHGKLLKKKHTQ